MTEFVHLDQPLGKTGNGYLPAGKIAKIGNLPGKYFNETHFSEEFLSRCGKAVKVQPADITILKIPYIFLYQSASRPPAPVRRQDVNVQVRGKLLQAVGTAQFPPQKTSDHAGKKPEVILLKNGPPQKHP